MAVVQNFKLGRFPPTWWLPLLPLQSLPPTPDRILGCALHGRLGPVREYFFSLKASLDSLAMVGIVMITSIDKGTDLPLVWHPTTLAGCCLVGHSFASVVMEHAAEIDLATGRTNRS